MILSNSEDTQSLLKNSISYHNPTTPCYILCSLSFVALEGFQKPSRRLNAKNRNKTERYSKRSLSHKRFMAIILLYSIYNIVLICRLFYYGVLRIRSVNHKKGNRKN